MNITLHNHKLIHFLDSNPQFDVENILLTLLPLLENTNVNDNLQHMLSQFQHSLSVQQQQQQSYEDKINTLISLSDERLNNIKLFLESSFVKYNKELELQLKGSIHNTDLLPKVENIIHSYNTRITDLFNNKDTQLVSLINQNNSTLQEVHSNLHNFTSSLQNSSKKGAISENRLEHLLPHIFPNINIKNTHSLPESGDFIIEHHICGNIMLENKDYKDNVGKSEIDKFIRDASLLNCHGIMMSQQTGIANKNHFQVEFNNGKILIYLHKVNYESQPLLDSVHIIQSLLQYADNTQSLEHSISDYQLNSLLSEWKNLHNTHNSIIQNLQSQIKQLRSQHLPTLDSFLKIKFPSNDNQCICSKCNRSFKNKTGLISHQKSCK